MFHLKEKLHDLWDNIKYFPYRIKEICSRIGRVVRMAPMIFDYRPWDHTFLFMLYHKVTEEHYNYYKNYNKFITPESAARNAKQLLVVKEIFKRLEEEYRYAEYWETKWFLYEKKIKVNETKETHEGTGMRLTSYHYNNPKEEKRARFLIKIYDKKQEELRNADIDLLCKYLKRYSQRWWD